jgi:hypothetical protein
LTHGNIRIKLRGCPVPSLLIDGQEARLLIDGQEASLLIGELEPISLIGVQEAAGCLRLVVVEP